MRQTMMDRWIEAAEAKRVCERAMAETPPLAVSIRQPSSLITKLSAVLPPSVVHRRTAFIPTVRSAA